MQDNSTNKLVIESIISRAEEEIKEATGVSAKLIIEPQYVDFDFLHKLADQIARKADAEIFMNKYLPHVVPIGSIEATNWEKA